MRYWKQPPATFATSNDDFDLALLEPDAGWIELADEAEFTAEGEAVTAASTDKPRAPTGNSYFVLRARGDGTLAVQKIVAALDYGREEDITNFIKDHADEPAIAGGIADWQANGIITLTLEDDDDSKQATMQGFLFLAIMSGRFEVPADVQALIFGAP